MGGEYRLVIDPSANHLMPINMKNRRGTHCEEENVLPGMLVAPIEV